MRACSKEISLLGTKKHSPRTESILTKILIAGAALALCTAGAAASEKYLCATSAVGGVAFDEQQQLWTGTRFKSEDKLIISQPPEDSVVFPHAKFIVTTLGSNSPHIGCESGFGSDDVLRCDSRYYMLNFNKLTLRFVEIYKAGFISGEDNNDNNPSVSIGECSPF